MPRYFFDLFNSDGPTRDEEGQELPSLQAARDRAVEAIRSILREELLHGEIDLRGRVEIRDEGGGVALVFAFQEAVTVRTGEPPSG